MDSKWGGAGLGQRAADRPTDSRCATASTDLTREVFRA